MKKTARVILYLAGSLVVLIILALIGLKLFFPVEKAKALAIEHGEQMLGREIAIAGVDISFWGGLGIRLEQVKIGNPKGWAETVPFLRAEDIDLKLQILPLFSQEYRIDRLLINRPEILLHRLKDGDDNFSFVSLDTMGANNVASQLSSEEKVVAAAVSFDALSINEGTIIYRDDSAHTVITASEFQLSTSLTNKITGTYESKGVLSIGQLDVLIDDTLQSVRVQLDYDADFTLSDRSLRVHDTKLTLNDIPIDVNGELQLTRGATVARFSFASDNLAVERIISVLPEEQRISIADLSLGGTVTLHTDIDYDSQREIVFKYAGTGSLNELSVRHVNVPERLIVKKGLIDIKNDNLRVTVEQASFKDEPFRLNMVVNDFTRPFVNADVTGVVDLAMLQPFIPDSTVDELSGEARLSLKVTGLIEDAKELQISGDIELSDGSCLPYNTLSRIDHINLSAHFDNETVLVKELTIHIDSSFASFEGRVHNLRPYMMSDDSMTSLIELFVDGKFNSEVDLNLLEHFLPQEDRPNLTGSANLLSTVKGNPLDLASLHLLGQLRVVDLAYSDISLSEPIRDLDAEIVISGDTLKINQLQMQFVSSNLNLNGVVSGFWTALFSDKRAAHRPMLDFTLSSSRFNVDSLFPEAAPATEAQYAAQRIDTIPPFILPDINARGMFSFDTLIYSDIPMTDVTGKIKLKNRLLTCSDINGIAYGGSMSGQTSIDLADMKSPQYVGTFKASQVDLSDVATRLSSFGEMLTGKIDLAGDYKGTGWDPEEFKRSLNMTLDASMLYGKIVTSGELFTNIKSLAAKVGQPINTEQPLKNLSTKITVEDGKVSFGGLKTRLGALGDLNLSGFYSFDGEISYSGGLQLSEGATSKLLSSGGLLSGLSGILTDKSVRRVKLPILIGGTMSHPKFDIDYSAIKDDIKNDLSDRAGSLLEGLFKKDKK